MNIKNILSSIKNKELDYSNYLLFGEEEYFIDKIESYFLKYTISDTEKSFNQKVFYGKDINVYSLVSMLRAFPMLGAQQLILIKEADKMDKIHELENYLIKPIPSSILVLSYKKKSIDKRKKWVKLFQKSGLVFESKKVYDYQFSKLIKSFLDEKNLKIEQLAEQLLIDHLGYDLSKIVNAINKLSKIISTNMISTFDVQAHIGIHREYNNFELQNAFAQKDVKKAISIANHFALNQNKYPLNLTIGVLFSFFSKLLIMHSLHNPSRDYIAKTIKVHPFFVSSYQIACKHYSFHECSRIISVLKEYDLNFKGINGVNSEHLIKDLILKIIYH